MASSLYRELERTRTDLLLYAADAQDALNRLPERVFCPGFAFVVTTHHLTRFVHSHVRLLTVVDGCLDCFKQRHDHSWLATPVPDYIIDVSPLGIACREPIIMSVAHGSLWGRHYNTGLDRKPTDPSFDEEARELVRLAEGAQQFLSMP